MGLHTVDPISGDFSLAVQATGSIERESPSGEIDRHSREPFRALQKRDRGRGGPQFSWSYFELIGERVINEWKLKETP